MQELSEEAVRTLYPDPAVHRISRGEYPPGTSYAGTLAVPGTAFVLSGSCRYVMEKGEIALSKGDFAELPRGAYMFYANGDEGAQVVRVYKIPEPLPL